MLFVLEPVVYVVESADFFLLGKYTPPKYPYMNFKAVLWNPFLENRSSWVTEENL